MTTPTDTRITLSHVMSRGEANRRAHRLARREAIDDSRRGAYGGDA